MPTTFAEERSRCPPTLRSILPSEILDDVCRRLPRRDLAPFLRVNSIFREISDRILYHTIEDLPLPQCVICLRTLANNHRLCSYVRTLNIDCNEAIPTSNFYLLLHCVLKQLTGLTNLSLEVPRQHPLFWVLSDCPFSLKHFATSLPCEPPLARFLESQPSIIELCLRGHQHDDHHHIIPFFDPLFVRSHDHANFSLTPPALPKLAQFKTIHGRPSIIAAVVEGRPVQMASIPLFPSLATEALQALAMSTRPIRRLSVMSFDPSADESLLTTIAKEFPYLEALHIVVLLTEYSNEYLRALGPSLRHFKSLQYITFMALINDSSEDDEHAIARLWHSCCPTLKTIILPKGKIWFHDVSKWISLGD